MNDLRATLVQTSIVWEDPTANRARYDDLLAGLAGTTDLVVLPEMFTTGFTMNPAPNAETMEGATVEWLRDTAARLEAVVTGSIVIAAEGGYYNRLLWMHPDGKLQTYDKRHRFAMAGEDEHYRAGNRRMIAEVRGWRVCPLVCYDLRFPVWSRNDDAYDLLLYTANWPDRRAYDWNTLLRARAIENQSYVVAVNRIGTDAAGHTYAGDSCVIDPGWRKTLYHAEAREEVHTEVLSADHLREVRGKLPFLRDRDDFTLHPIG